MFIGFIVLCCTLAIVHGQGHFQLSYIAEQMDQYCNLRNGESTHDVSTPSRVAPRVGKAGPSGPPGRLGPRGYPGVVNYTTVETFIEAVVGRQMSAFSVMEETIASLKNSLERMEEENEEMREKIRLLNVTAKAATECGSDEFRYDDKCYWVVVHDESYYGDVNFAEAKSICENRQGSVAYPTSRPLYDVMMTQIRQKIPSGWGGVGIWLGIYQSPSTGQLSVSDSKEKPFIKWGYGQPSLISSETNVYLYVDRDINDRHNGMGDTDPSRNRHGVICQH